MITLDKNVHFSNAELPMYSKDCGRFNFSNDEHSINAFCKIFFNFELGPKTTSSSDEQQANPDVLISITESGIVIFLSDMHKLNNFSGIVVMCCGIFICVKFLHLSKS